MRFLNKIVFINTADKSLRYAEVSLDGNVHFIGTQGVGKSTLLRTILFFYNADKQKLGIKAGQKNYDEYYYPYQNSYIVYEVQTDKGAFCVITFKSQGRVAFRFLDSAYDKNYFIDSEGKASESWDKIREALGRNVNSTRIVSSYEEYKNILYGNNKGLQNEFRKYALIESKQFQNIPRTITNVFLNTKLDAEFVKETIIKSLNEDEIKIDLSTYSQTHLRDFEAHLNDIRKWTDRNKTGGNSLEKQAEKVSELYASLMFLDKEKEQLARQLGWALNNVKEQKPRFEELRTSEELKQNKTQIKINELGDAFDKKKGEIQKQIGIYSDKLKSIKLKRDEYRILEIDKIIQRVNQRPTLELQKKNLSDERDILSSKFLEIQTRYQVLMAQVTNQLKEFENSKQTEANGLNAAFTTFKEDLTKQYEAIVETIKKQNQEELKVAQELVNDKGKSITDQKIKRAEIKNKKFYDLEIDQCRNEISALNATKTNAENSIKQALAKIETLKKEWQLDEDRVKGDAVRSIDRKNEQQEHFKRQIEAIDSKIENSKDSLYGWLNTNIPDWAETIGKVIDEENVLFLSGLNPRKISDSDLNLYGICIDTQEIGKQVKTVADLQNDKENLLDQIQTVQQEIAKINVQQSEDLERLRKKFHSKIKDQKDIFQNNEYKQVQSNLKIDAINVRLNEWESKAKKDKQSSLDTIENEIVSLTEQKLKAEEQLQKIVGNINKLIAGKKKEKEEKINAEQLTLNGHLLKIKEEIQNEQQVSGKKLQEIKLRQNGDLESQGANTKRIGEIDLRLAELNAELGYIENNRDKVAEYNQDKRELFDKEDEFKNQKSQNEKKLDTEKEKYEQQKNKLNQELTQIKNQIESVQNEIDKYNLDIETFESFIKTELFASIQHHVQSYSETDQTTSNCRTLIIDLQTNENTYTRRYIDLQESVNKFAGNFQENNLFSFKVKFVDKSDYFDFADMIKEFIDENKIDEYKKRFEARFASIIKQIGRETNQLVEKEGEISQVVKDINTDFMARNFVGAIKSMELKTDKSANAIFQLLVDIANFNDNNQFDLGEVNLFSSSEQTNKNEKAIQLLKDLIKAMAGYKEKEITLSDSFELLFKIVENDNDTGWVEKLTNVGSEGTDTLVKAMINIMLLNVFKEKADKKNKGDFRLHCMMDEIGKLHPTNVKGILKFANDRNILLINSSPTSYNAADYRYTYLLAKDAKNATNVSRIVSKKI